MRRRRRLSVVRHRLRLRRVVQMLLRWLLWRLLLRRLRVLRSSIVVMWLS